MDVHEQMQRMRDELQAAREERARLFQMLQDMQHRYDRLLDRPRPAPQDAPQAPAGPTPVRRRPQRAHVPQRPPQGPPAAQGAGQRGAMRRRILTLLQDYPEGLTPAAMRTVLSVDRSLADTCLGMLRYGLVQRVGRGQYMPTAPTRHEIQ